MTARADLDAINRLAREALDLAAGAKKTARGAAAAALEVGRRLEPIRRQLKGADWQIWADAHLTFPRADAERWIKTGRQLEFDLKKENGERVVIQALEILPKKAAGIKGDVKFSRPGHWLSVVNRWAWFKRKERLDDAVTGIAPARLEQMKRDLEPMFVDLCKLYGIDPPARR